MPGPKGPGLLGVGRVLWDPPGKHLRNRRGEVFHEMINVTLVRTEAQYADAPEKSVVCRAPGQHHASPLRRAFEQRARAVVLLLASGAGPGDVKSKERELRRRVDHDMRESGDAAPRIERQSPLFSNRLAKSGGC